MRERKEIFVEIGQAGELSVEGMGFEGEECIDSIDPLLESLGFTKDEIEANRQDSPEMRINRNQKDRERMRSR